MPGEDSISVDIVAAGKAPERPDETPDEMSLTMIEALVDEFAVNRQEKGKISISMHKKHKETAFD
jgi:anti-sigma regulatory factor (Ser/Thr protein kinase)